MKTIKPNILFRIDLLSLYRHFKRFSENEMIGVANDLTPHYFNLMRAYRHKNPETHVGTPGRHQVSDQYELSDDKIMF